MSEFSVKKYALMCMRLAAECRGLAADVPEPDLRGIFASSVQMLASRRSCIDALRASRQHPFNIRDLPGFQFPDAREIIAPYPNRVRCDADRCPPVFL
jgi:hypothetical protein